MCSVNRFAVVAFVAVFGLATLWAPVFSQSRSNASGTGGIHEIRGRVHLPNGKAIETPIKVKLESYSFGSLSVLTDHSGAYSFKGLAPGVYSVVVDEAESFESARESVTLDTEVELRGTVRIPPVPKLVTVPIHLRAKRQDVLRNEVINAKWANVPKDAVEHYERGIELMRDNKPDAAVAELKRSVEIFQGFAPAHAALGKYYLVTGKLDDAVNYFRSALKYDPADFDARLNIGIALLNGKHLNDAELELKAAAVQDRNAVTPRFYLGLVFVQRHDLDSAQKELEAARDLSGVQDFPLVHKYLGGVYWQKGRSADVAQQKNLYKLAVEELEKYVKLMPKAQDAERIKETIVQLRAGLS